MITLTRAGLLALVLGTHSAATAAQTQWYTVELIVFSMLEPDIASESWTERPGRPSLEGSIELMSTLGLAEDSELGSVAAFRALPDDDLALSKEWSRLKRSAGYRPLLRVAWRQPGFSREESRAVHLHTPLTDVERPALAPRSGRTTPSLADTGESLSRPTTREPGLDGTIRVWRERYLHVEADLRYSLRAENAPTLEGNVGSQSAGAPLELVHFRLTERRRMRSRKLHFLDHPVFGMLVEITPFDPPPTADEQPAPSTDRNVTPPAPASQAPTPTEQSPSAPTSSEPRPKPGPSPQSG